MKIEPRVYMILVRKRVGVGGCSAAKYFEKGIGTHEWQQASRRVYVGHDY